MALAGKQKPTSWHSAVQEDPVLVGDSDDILLPLKRVRAEFAKKADELESKAYGEKREQKLASVVFYRDAVDAVGLLIDSSHNCSAFVEEPAPVDQTEEILLDEAVQ